MTLRSFLVLLAFVPAVSLANPPHSASLRTAKMVNPAVLQAQQDTPKAPRPVARNGHLRLEVYVGAVDTVPITVSENGAPVTFARQTVSTGRRGNSTIELVPARELKAGALVLVHVDGIRSATFRVASAADTTAPTFVKASVESFRSNVPTRSQWNQAPNQDEVEISVTVTDESTVRVRGVVLGADGGRIESTMSAFASNSNATTTLLTFPVGTLPTGGPLTLRLEAIDGAGNVATSNELVKAAVSMATPDAAAPATSAAAPTSAAPDTSASAPLPVQEPPAARRGC